MFNYIIIDDVGKLLKQGFCCFSLNVLALERITKIYTSGSSIGVEELQHSCSLKNFKLRYTFYKIPSIKTNIIKNEIRMYTSKFLIKTGKTSIFECISDLISLYILV